MGDPLDRRLFSLSLSQRSPPRLLAGEEFLIASFGVKEQSSMYCEATEPGY